MEREVHSAPIYRSNDDEEWPGWQNAIWLSVQEADIIVIDSNDKDDNGGSEASGEAVGKDSEEDDATPDFSAFDYRC
jgi:hypothetical protein